MPHKDPQKRKEYHTKYMAKWRAEQGEEYKQQQAEYDRIRNQTEHCKEIHRKSQQKRKDLANLTARNKYRERKAMLFTMLGGKCNKCGSVEKLEFDHIDRNNKNFNIGRAMNCSLTKLIEELKKCQLLCHQCHREKSGAEKDCIPKRPNPTLSNLKQFKNN